MSDDERRHALAHELGLPFVALGRDDIAPEAMMLIPEPLSREHNAVGYQVGEGGLEVALLDPADLDALYFLRSQYRLLPRLVTREDMIRALLHYQKHLYEVYGRHLERGEGQGALDTLLRHALVSHASDIHLQTTDKGFLVRYRINGTLKDAMTLPAATGARLVDKLRTLARLPASSLPREARLRVDLGHGEEINIGVASMPTIGGEKLLLSLTRNRERRGWTLHSLGLHGEALERVHKTLLHRRGVIAITGAPASGKTTLLYTMLDLLNTPEISVATVEQSVAEILPRVAQTDLAVTGLSVGAALRAALRTDPDAVLLDELGDSNSAAVAGAAALRGLLIVATTTQAELLPQATFTVRTALLRKLCDKKFLQKSKLTRAEADTLEDAGANFANVLAALKEEDKVAKDTAWKDITFARASGCSECDGGYQGLLGVQEVAAQEGVVGLNVLEDALYKAAQGLTSIEEVLALV